VSRVLVVWVVRHVAGAGPFWCCQSTVRLYGERGELVYNAPRFSGVNGLPVRQVKARSSQLPQASVHLLCSRVVLPPPPCLRPLHHVLTAAGAGFSAELLAATFPHLAPQGCTAAPKRQPAAARCAGHDARGQRPRTLRITADLGLAATTPRHRQRSANGVQPPGCRRRRKHNTSGAP
jgi:hypothetical protein